jgi:hypothetical protein
MLGAARGGSSAFRPSYGVVAHFGVLVVRHPRCEPIGYPTGCRMLNEATRGLDFGRHQSVAFNLIALPCRLPLCRPLGLRSASADRQEPIQE